MCHDGLRADDEALRWTCAACQTCAHTECVAEFSRCPTLGCEGALPSAARALRYHEMLEQRDGWLLRRIPPLGAGLGGLLGGLEALLRGDLPGLVPGVLTGVVLGFMTLGLIGTVVAFVAWELYRKLTGAREPWDA
ncbi:MAG: hypothetical protein KDD82_21480 [Planctomycetes bacterium]|nr:hypothetical protein [Planctomycetota bacterium]